MTVFSKRSLEGEITIDHSSVVAPRFECAGVPAGTIFEAPTITCSHCQVIVVMNPARTRPRGYCRKCDHYICDKVECNLECRSFKKFADDFQEAALKELIRNG